MSGWLREGNKPPHGSKDTRGPRDHLSEAVEGPTKQVHSGGSTGDNKCHRILVGSKGYSSKEKQEFKQIGEEKEDEET